MRSHIGDLLQYFAALLAGGGVAAVIGWRKPRAEADKIKAEAEELVWGHMKETIERLQADVDELKAGRDNRDKQIAMLQKANAECVAREKGLVRRLGRLEKQLGELTPP
jgi:uncharacterized coiled-coil DUF342 family protein